MRILAVGDFQGVFPAKLKRKIVKEQFDLIVGVGDYGGIKDWKPYLHDFFKRVKKGEKILSAEEYFGKKIYKALLKKNMKATKRVLKELNSIEKPIISVFGNSDDELYNYPFENGWPKRKKSITKFLKGLDNFKDITYGKTKFERETFFGFGGYMEAEVNFLKSKFNNTLRMERRMKRHLNTKRNLNSRLKGIEKDFIFVLHYPPLGVFDIIGEKGNSFRGKSAGVDIFRDAIKKHQPKLVFCGHMHEYQGMKKLYGVPIINPGDAEVGKAAIIDIKDKSVKVKFIK